MEARLFIFNVWIFFLAQEWRNLFLIMFSLEGVVENYFCFNPLGSLLGL